MDVSDAKPLKALEEEPKLERLLRSDLRQHQDLLAEDGDACG